MAADAFTGADGTPLATHDSNWASPDATFVVGNFRIENNQCETTGASSSAGARYTGSTVDSSQVDLPVPASGRGNIQNRFVAVRLGASSLGYALNITTVVNGAYTKAGLFKNNAFVQFLSTGNSWATGSVHTLKITADGTDSVTINGFVDGVNVGSYTDSSSPLGTGNPGFYATGGGFAVAPFDNWSDGGGGGGVSLPPQRSLMGFGQ